jgi:hypothetical protein
MSSWTLATGRIEHLNDGVADIRYGIKISSQMPAFRQRLKRLYQVV